MKQFDPNSINRPNYQWASYIEGRTPEFKVHRLRGHAMNALGGGGSRMGRTGIVYEFIDNKWVEIDRNEVSYDCFFCGQETRMCQTQSGPLEATYYPEMRTKSSGFRFQKRAHYLCWLEKEPHTMNQYTKKRAIFIYEYNYPTTDPYTEIGIGRWK